MLKKKISNIVSIVALAGAILVVSWFIYGIDLSPEIIINPVEFRGTKNIVRSTQALEAGSLVDKETLVLTYDLHGLCILPGPASAIELTAVNGKTFSVSLANYGVNCAEGAQTVKIPIEDFFITQDLKNINSLAIQFWYPTTYDVEIEKIKTYEPALLGFSTEEARDLLLARVSGRNLPKSSRINTKKTPSATPTPRPSASPPPAGGPTPTPTPKNTPSAGRTPRLAPTPTSTPIPTLAPVAIAGSWSIRSVSSMKETKDKICGQDSATFINSWIDKAVELGVNYIAVETPYDNPACGSSVKYTKAWVDAVHARGLNVWHRHMPLAFEGIYDTAKDSSKNYLPQISDYIKANPSFFQSGDIFSPIPEPQNGGISGVTYCPQNICIFSDAAVFNKWLRDAIASSESAFTSIDLGGKIKIGYYGFDGFVAWGDNNPDWQGILEDATVQKMGNITIDHYPEIVGDTMENDLNELQAKYPNTPIIIGEWGTITGGDTLAEVKNTMQAALRKNVIGFNYWHMGLGGNEALVTDVLTSKLAFDAVKSFFTK